MIKLNRFTTNSKVIEKMYETNETYSGGEGINIHLPYRAKELMVDLDNSGYSE